MLIGCSIIACQPQSFKHPRLTPKRLVFETRIPSWNNALGSLFGAADEVQDLGDRLVELH